MARRRYLSTAVSLDKELNRVAEEAGDFAALFYSWLIPHAEDDTTVCGDPDELFYLVCPRRRDKTPEDVRQAIDVLVSHGLLWRYTDEKGKPRLQFPPETFYKYQTYIPKDKRNYHDFRSPSPEGRTVPHNTEEHREPPKNAVSPSPSPSPIPRSSLLSSTATLYRTPTPPEPEENDNDDNGLGDALDFAGRNLSPTGYLRPVEIQKVRKWIGEGLHGECVKHAVTLAIENGKANFAYIDAICRRWIDSGLKTMKDVLAQEEAYRRQKQRSRSPTAFEPPVPQVQVVSEEEQERLRRMQRELAERLSIERAVSTK